MLTGENGLRVAFALAFLMIAAHCAARAGLPARRRGSSHLGWGRDVDAAHVLMALGMAAMLSPWGDPLPAAAWAGMFAGATAWFASRLVHAQPAGGGRPVAAPLAGAGRGLHLHHVVAMGGMTLMALAMRGVPAGGSAGVAGAMPGMGSSGSTAGFLTSIATEMALVGLLCYFLAFAAWSALRARRAPLRLSPAGGAGPVAAEWVVLSPGVTLACETVMGIGMAYMLLAML